MFAAGPCGPEVASCRLHLGLGREIDCAAHADIVEMRIEKTAGGAAAQLMQPLEEIVIGIELAVGVETVAAMRQRNAVDVDRPILTAVTPLRQPAPAVVA